MFWPWSGRNRNRPVGSTRDLALALFAQHRSNERHHVRSSGEMFVLVKGIHRFPAFDANIAQVEEMHAIPKP